MTAKYLEKIFTSKILSSKYILRILSWLMCKTTEFPIIIIKCFSSNLLLILSLLFSSIQYFLCIHQRNLYQARVHGKKVIQNDPCKK